MALANLKLHHLNGPFAHGQEPIQKRKLGMGSVCDVYVILNELAAICLNFVTNLPEGGERIHPWLMPLIGKTPVNPLCG